MLHFPHTRTSCEIQWANVTNRSLKALGTANLGIEGDSGAGVELQRGSCTGSGLNCFGVLNNVLQCLLQPLDDGRPEATAAHELHYLQVQKLLSVGSCGYTGSIHYSARCSLLNRKGRKGQTSGKLGNREGKSTTGTVQKDSQFKV